MRPITWKVVPQETDGGKIRPSFKSDISQKNILGLDRPTPFSLPTGKRGLPLSLAVLEDTVKVLVLKIEFQPEIPDDPKTTGIGTFDMRSYDEFVAQEHHYIDPAPHGTAYFNSHMEGLRRYWYFVSDKKLDLSWDIFPQPESSTFRLPVKMSYYGSEGPWADSSVADKLGHFLIDAITFADSAAPEIDFSQYQAIIIFHAGSDQQNNFAFINDTPDDFYTGFIRLAEPVIVDNGAFQVSEALQVPETESQDNRITALNGVLAHEFGHQLGLVDLYDTYNFMTQIGDFSLMDNNGMSVGVEFDSISSSVGGTIPVYPDAWSRAYLGFDVPKVVSRMGGESVSAAVLNYSESEIVKVPITDFEYYLIENRQQVNHETALIADHQTGVILGPGYLDNEGLLVANGEYDLFCPGNGMLIWHIDEYPAYQNYTGSPDNNFFTNTLQWDKDRRFVSLVEADGVVDFGGNYYRGYGDQNDFFRAGGPTAMTPFTRPPSRTNLGADSHVFITNVSASDTIMTVDIDNNWLLPGWPQMSRPAAMSDPIITDVGALGSNAVVMAGGNQLLAWRFDGSKIIPNYDSIGFMRYDSSIAVYPLAVIADCNTDIVGRPVAVDFDGDGINELAAVTTTGRLYAVRAADDDHDGRGDALTGFPYQIGAGVTLPPIAVNFLARPGQQLLVFRSSEVHLIYSNPPDSLPVDSLIFAWEYDFPSASAYSVAGKNVVDLIERERFGHIIRMTADSGAVNFQQAFRASYYDPAKYLISGDVSRSGGMPDIVLVSGRTVRLIGADGALKWAVDIRDELGRPALGDINSDGFPEVVVAGNAKIYAISYNGVMLDNFPINMRLYDTSGIPDTSAITSPPILGDVDGDDNPDIIIGLPAGSIYAFNYHADKLSGFPLPSSFGISRACALGDINADGRIDLVTVENPGFVKAWAIDTSYIAADVPWGNSGGTPGNSGYLNPIYEKPMVSADLQLPENSVFNYPNPARNTTTIRYYLNSDSRVNIDIFDFMGERVHDIQLAGLGHVSNEYVWDCSSVASGIYFCRVEAVNDTGKNWRMIKIAIAK